MAAILDVILHECAVIKLDRNFISKKSWEKMKVKDIAKLCVKVRAAVICKYFIFSF